MLMMVTMIIINFTVHLSIFLPTRGVTRTREHIWFVQGRFFSRIGDKFMYHASLLYPKSIGAITPIQPLRSDLYIHDPLETSSHEK